MTSQLSMFPTTQDTVKTLLQKAGFGIVGEMRNGNDTGWWLRIDCDAIVTVYDSGKVLVQGQNPEPVLKTLERGAP